MNKRNTQIGFFCKQCKQHATKSASYMVRRIREGKTDFFCSRSCADKYHSSAMKGESNPNFNGKFYGELVSDWSKEKREEATRKMLKTRAENGTFLGPKNGRWAGGSQVHTCVICGKESEFRPYVHRKILAGKQSPTCSVKCSIALGRRSIPLKSTSIEIKMAEELSRRGIEFVEQYNLGDKFRLDFLLPEYGIVIECDGDYWHNIAKVKARDKSKNAYIKACGFSLYRFWEHEINADVSGCVDKIDELKVVSMQI